MKHAHFLLWLTLSCTGVTSIAAEEKEKSPPPYTPPAPVAKVATLSLDWQDAKRTRAVPVKIYYPQEGPGPFPVILFSHGLGGSREGYAYLGQHWAACGYVSVHLQHIGSDDSVWKGASPADRTKSLQGSAMNLSNITNRPLDVQFALDEVLKLNTSETSPLRGRLDTQAIGVAGHSFGGHTTLLIAGQSLGPLGKKFSDPRIKAAIQMSAPAPALRNNLDAIFDGITIPLMHMTGTQDFVEILPQTKPEDRRVPYDHMRHSETCLVIFKDGDHMIFSGRGPTTRPEKAPQDLAFQKLICATTTAFWDAYLKKNPATKTWLLQGGCEKLLGAQATFEHKSPSGG